MTSMTNVTTVATLGAAIRSARREHGWTQADLADRAGVSRQTLISLERGNPNGEIGIVMRVLAALHRSLLITEAPVRGTDLDDVLGGPGP